MSAILKTAKWNFSGIRPSDEAPYTRVLYKDESVSGTRSSLDSEEGYSPPQAPWHAGSSFKRLRELATPVLLLSFLGICGLIALVAATATSGVTISISSTNIQPAPCGSTPEQALARGCHFDLISFSWLPDQCYDPELTQEFLDIEDWKWFKDGDATIPLTRDQVLTGEHTSVFVSFGQHIKHRTTVWRKMHRALHGKGKKAIDGYMDEMIHTTHCEFMLLSY